MGMPYDELSYWVAGINHMAWFLDLRWQGKDAYPLLHRRLEEWDAAGGDAALAMNDMPDNPYYGKSDPWVWDTVRRDLYRRFGYYVTESTAHLSEYLPYFRRDAGLMASYALRRRDEGFDGTTWRERRAERRAKRWDETRAQIESKGPIPMERSTEYTSHIIEAMETGSPYRVNVNVRNTGLVTNLPDNCVVEVPCLVDRLGVHPCYVGDLPPQLAALNRSNVAVQELAVKAALEGDRTALYRAVALDPLTASLLSLSEIQQMVDEMIEALSPWMPQFGGGD
jgi:alpha-galactosidase